MADKSRRPWQRRRDLAPAQPATFHGGWTMTLRKLAFGMAFLTTPAFADDPPICPKDAEPVVSLGFGSRYAADSASRSDFDEESDKAVTAALKPIDTFIADLSRQTDLLNDPETKPDIALAAATCVQESILAWAEADALSDLKTQGANLSAPSRVGGIAFAYAAAKALLPDAEGNAEIESWLLARARQAMTFFDEDAPPRASQNNLRAWAGLAVTRIGLTLDDPALMDWGNATARLVACTAAEDGSLPNEMWRDGLALHYQLHAIAPLVTTAALLEDQRPGVFEACNGAIRRAVTFTISGLIDPAPVEELTGKRQSVGGPDHPPRDFELAWVPAYLRYNPDDAISDYVKDIKLFGNSKLGGNQTLLWPDAEDSATDTTSGSELPDDKDKVSN
ncbi:MAG: alginate lyase [Acetobacteraceae bacterium]|nr:MAG: alginate lyase [Acetobacteraceae bacterium]